MSPEELDRRLIAALEDFHRRRALGEPVKPEEYRDRLGDGYPRFVEIIRRLESPEPPRPSVSEALPRVFGSYLLESVLGGGGMGIVYQAFHPGLARRVAVKVLPRSLETNASTVERFRREARACAQVRHPNVVVVHEDGEADGQLFYAMDLVAGKSLQAHIDDRTVPEPKALFAAMSDVADALEALHRAGVVHRDVKPSNLIVQPDGRIVLADFGLARTFTAPGLTQTGEALGTPPYMSPEQLLGRVREVDARTDVYGLGATIYHALAGAPPFAARESSDLVRMVLVERPQGLRARRPDLTVETENVVAKALEKRKEDRYTTAGDLRDDLRRVASGDQPVGSPVPRWRRVTRAVGGHALTAAVAAALLIGAGSWWWWVGRPASMAIQVDADLTLEAMVDGVVHGVTGHGEMVVVRGLDAGDYEVTLRYKDVSVIPAKLHLRPGADALLRDSEFRLAPDEIDDDVKIISRLTSHLYKAVESWGKYEASRGVLEPELLPFLPRGDVRLVDATLLEVEVGDGYDADRVGERFVVVVRDSDGNQVGPEIKIRPKTDAKTWTPPPESAQELAKALAKVAPGTTLRWMIRDRRSRDTPPKSAVFTLVDRDPSADLAHVDLRLALESERVRSLVRSRVLLAYGLPTAAARELIANTPAAGRSFHEAASLYQALHRIGPADLDGSRVKSDAHELLDAVRKRDGEAHFLRYFPDAPALPRESPSSSEPPPPSESPPK